MNRLNKTESDIFISWMISSLPKGLIFGNLLTSLHFSDSDEAPRSNRLGIRP